MKFSIRRLTTGDADDYRAIRLKALRDLPEVFFSSHEEASRLPESYWKTLFDGDRTYFGAFAVRNLAGIADYERKTGNKAAHKSWLYGMYVLDEARGLKIHETYIDQIFMVEFLDAG